ncbi:succinate-semialdehyde dehydrogenase [Dactylonectria macrodidyma]|uniref:succinate-semialdehyde dehydrogenase [NAD(P)(+)] n=1 Tax=Dactylonectria macrodidyma TaxID=307937 RepID=A0A9P9FVN9_9HYPO|nr:succinate-semialdehyde dehydrogenase [Dactylonectria macrodidyma]
MAADLTPKFDDPSLLHHKGYIDGEWTTGNSKATFNVQDPATGWTIGSCPEMTCSDVEKAIYAASTAQATFRHVPAKDRAAILTEWAHLMRRSQEDLAKLVTWENGKPLAEARGEVLYAAAFLDWFAGEAIRVTGDFIQPGNMSNRAVVKRDPIGVCGFITPWNFPLAMVTRKTGPALAAGCTVVLKAPGETPLTALALAHLGAKAGIPKGVFNVITALENTVEVGTAITESSIIRKISFTGSTPVGKLLMRQSSATLKRLSMELGGLAPFIVFDDADIDDAVEGAITCKFRGSGQTCVCANTFFIHENVYQQFSERFIGKVRKFCMGHGFKDGVTHGPLIHERAVHKVVGHVQDAKAKGGHIAIGGQKMPHLGPAFFEPTVVLNATPEMLFTKDETFGPLAGFVKFSSEDEVVDLANRAEVGLAAYFYSNDVKRCWRVAEKLEAGMVGINTGIISDVATPFGGIKHSGFGREGSKYGIEDFLTLKTITFGGIVMRPGLDGRNKSHSFIQ